MVIVVATFSYLQKQQQLLSPKLFTAVMEEVFKKADISEGINVDGENLTNLRFADDAAIFNKQNKTNKQMEKHLNSLSSESLKVGLKYTRERQSTRQTMQKVKIY